MACACLVTGEVVESYTWPCFPFLILSSEMQDVHRDVEMFPLMTKSHFEGKLSVLVAAMFLCSFTTILHLRGLHRTDSVRGNGKI